MRHFRELIDELPVRAHLAFLAGTIVHDKNLSGTFDERRAEELGLVMRRDPVSGVQRAWLTLSFAGDLEKVARESLATTTSEQWKLLSERAPSVRPHLLSAMYFDLLWAEHRRHKLPKPIEFARAAMEKYAEAARERVGQGDLFVEAWEACRSLIAIAREVTDVPAILGALRLIGTLADALESVWRKQPGWPLRSAKAFIWAVGLLKKKERTPEILEEVRVMLARLERLGPDGDLILSSPAGRDILKYRADLEKILGVDTRKLRERQAAESMVQHARMCAEAGDNLSAGAIMMNAVQAFTALGETAQVTQAKKDVRELLQKSSRQMQTFSIKVYTPVGPMLAWLADVVACPDLGSALRRALQGSKLIPSVAAARAAAAETAAETPLLADMPAMAVVDGRPVSAPRDGLVELEQRHWTIALRTAVLRQWRSAMEKLKLEKGMTAESLVTELQKAGIVPGHNPKAVRRAVDASFDGDHLAACHMLPPIVEAALRHVLAARGVDTTAFSTADGGKLQERIGVFFAEDGSAEAAAAKRALGEDLWAWYRTVLFDETGMNLRNRAAHGLLHDAECGPETSETLLLALVALLRLAKA